MTQKPPIDLLRAALDALRDPLFVVDANLQCLYANKALFAFLNIRTPGRWPWPVTDIWPDVTLGDLARGELSCELRTKVGEIFSVRMLVEPLPDYSYLFRVLAGAARNDTVQNFHAQRLETLGMLAGGVAHDFNNVLAGILGHVTYLKTILPQRGPHVESLSAIEEGGKKATSITQQILNFSRLEVEDRSSTVNLADLVVRTCGLLRGAISPDIEIEPRIVASSASVLGVEGRLAQVIVNLAVNSRDAMPSGGKIQVSLESVEDLSRVRSAFQNTDLPCAKYVCLSVLDNGQGMTDEVLSRIFEPYYSTKKEKGTGLGLSTVASIVRQYGGAMEVTSEVNVGTRFCVYLPLVEQAGAKKAVKASPKQLERGSERILVVDDEYPVRNVLAVSLQHLGYKVDVAASGLEAIELYEDSPSRFDLVILDMLMPALSGEKVFFRLKAICEAVRVLLISGYASEEAVRNVLSHGGLDFIQKPFTIEELSRRVRACLDPRVQ